MGRNSNIHSKAQFKAEFAKRLENISVTDNLSQEETTKILRGLFDFVIENVPTQLFRFRKCGKYAFDAFKQGEIQMCVASRFSDKNDSRFYYDYASLSERLKPIYCDLIPLVLFALISSPSHFADVPLKEKLIRLTKTEFLPKEVFVEMIVEYRSVFDIIKQYIEKYMLYPRDNKDIHISCFTEDVTSKFMWDTYADGYKGFALEYNFKDWYISENKWNQQSSVDLFPIIYSSEKYNATKMIDAFCINSLHTLINDFYKNHFGSFIKKLPFDTLSLFKAYLYKDKTEYAHEKEWRLLSLRNTDDKQDYSNISDLGFLKAIYYGPDITKRNKTILSNIAREKGIIEYDVAIDENSKQYKLKIIPIKS